MHEAAVLLPCASRRQVLKMMLAEVCPDRLPSRHDCQHRSHQKGWGGPSIIAQPAFCRPAAFGRHAGRMFGDCCRLVAAESYSCMPPATARNRMVTWTIWCVVQWPRAGCCRRCLAEHRSCRWRIAGEKVQKPLPSVGSSCRIALPTFRDQLSVPERPAAFVSIDMPCRGGRSGTPARSGYRSTHTGRAVSGAGRRDWMDSAISPACKGPCAQAWSWIEWGSCRAG